MSKRSWDLVSSDRRSPASGSISRFLERRAESARFSQQTFACCGLRHYLNRRWRSMNSMPRRSIMLRPKAYLLLILVLLLGIVLVAESWATIALDVDVSTPGIQSSIAVPAGTTVTVKAIYTPLVTSTPPPPLYAEGLGLDLNWGFAGDLATATPALPVPDTQSPSVPSFTKTGLLAAAVPPGAATDITGTGIFGPPTSAGVIVPGVGLALPPGLPLAPGVAVAAFNIGGGGYFDLMPSGFAGGAFGGVIDTQPPSPLPISYDLMGWDMTITGTAGDSVTFAPSGISVAGFFASGAFPFADFSTLTVWSTAFLAQRSP